MMSALQMFRFDDQATLIVTLHDVDGFHVQATPVARALGFRDAFDLLRSIPDAEKGSELVRTPGGEQIAGYLTEAGFYRILGQRQAARVTDAEVRERVIRFQAWVFGTVLPAIRQSGCYSSYPAIPAQLPSKKELAQWVIQAEERAEIAEAQVLELTPPAAAWNKLAESAGDYSVADAAKVLSRDPNIDTGERRLFKFMQSIDWVYRREGRWKAYQSQVDCGRLDEKVNEPFTRNGEMFAPPPTVRITPKGLAELHRRLGGSGQLALVAAS